MPFTTLIDPAELALHLNDPQWVTFDCRSLLGDSDSGRRAYELGHIPGARFAHLEDDLASPVTPATGRHPLPDSGVLAKKLGAWGVGETTQVVAYDASSGSHAVRLWWLLRWLGHTNVAVLNGGFPRWEREGLPVTAAAPTPTPTTFPVRKARAFAVSAAEVDSARLDSAWRVIDARANQRFIGAIEPIDKVAGHIPGSVNAPWEGNIDGDGNFLDPATLRARFESVLDGVAPDHAIVSCGSGVTACHNALAMEHAGLPGAKLYAGSWSEWITNPDRPVARG